VDHGASRIPIRLIRMWLLIKIVAPPYVSNEVVLRSDWDIKRASFFAEMKQS